MADNEKMREAVQRKDKNNVKRKVKRKVKRLHPLPFVICFLALALGIGAGIGAYTFISRDDCFVINGEKNYEVSVGTEFTYVDEGAKVIAFGRDVSDKVKVETNLTEVSEGKYTADTTKTGEYYIIYTVDSAKYGEVQRVRVITVKGGS